MAYPEPDTPEWWDGVAAGYRQLITHPPKFITPGSGPDHFRKKAQEAEAMAAKLRRPVEFTKPSPEVEKSLKRVDPLAHYDGTMPEGPKVLVNQEVWNQVFKLD